jgi:hypothetical protein
MGAASRGAVLTWLIKPLPVLIIFYAGDTLLIPA